VSHAVHWGSLCCPVTIFLGGQYFFIIFAETFRKLKIKFYLRQWIFNNDIPNIWVIRKSSPPSQESSLVARSYFISSNTSL